MAKFGDFFKEKRIALGLTLRNFCNQNGLDPGNISKLERGLMQPPQKDKLTEYAVYLGIEAGSDEWYRFCDLAHSEIGTIPHDILSDEEVVDKLPILFSKLRSKKLNDEQLNKLIRKVKGQRD